MITINLADVIWETRRAPHAPQPINAIGRHCIRHLPGFPFVPQRIAFGASSNSIFFLQWTCSDRRSFGIRHFHLTNNTDWTVSTADSSSILDDNRPIWRHYTETERELFSGKRKSPAKVMVFAGIAAGCEPALAIRAFSTVIIDPHITGFIDRTGVIPN
jgi:hypothetical protein